MTTQSSSRMLAIELARNVNGVKRVDSSAVTIQSGV
jgi:hypothetical protein